MNRIKTITITVVAICILLMLAACSSGAGSSSGNASVTTAATAKTEAAIETIETTTLTETAEAEVAETEDAEASEEQAVIDTSWYTDNNTAICSGVFFVGKDIAAGNYILTCQNTPWTMEVDIFESADKYWSYHKSSRFTVGEESDALEANALSVNYVYADDNCAVNLQDGYVLRIEGGNGLLARADGSDSISGSVTGNSTKVVAGLYNVGDIKSGSYMLTCTKTDYAMKVIAFEDKTAYDSYMKADHFTVGEESAAIEQSALLDFYPEEGESVYLNVRDGMILMFDYGEAQLEPVNMSWAR